LFLSDLLSFSGEELKILDIKKKLLLSHLGLVGINEELLDTFPVKNLVEKSDDQVCLTYIIHFPDSNPDNLLKSIEIISKVLHVDKRSIEKPNKSTLSIQVFYDSLLLHWSDKAKEHFDELATKLMSYKVKISTSVSTND